MARVHLFRKSQNVPSLDLGSCDSALPSTGAPSPTERASWTSTASASADPASPLSVGGRHSQTPVQYAITPRRISQGGVGSAIERLSHTSSSSVTAGGRHSHRKGSDPNGPKASTARPSSVAGHYTRDARSFRMARFGSQHSTTSTTASECSSARNTLRHSERTASERSTQGDTKGKAWDNFEIRDPFGSSFNDGSSCDDQGGLDGSDIDESPIDIFASSSRRRPKVAATAATAPAPAAGVATGRRMSSEEVDAEFAKLLRGWGTADTGAAAAGGASRSASKRASSKRASSKRTSSKRASSKREAGEEARTAASAGVVWQREAPKDELEEARLQRGIDVRKRREELENERRNSFILKDPHDVEALRQMMTTKPQDARSTARRPSSDSQPRA